MAYPTTEQEILDAVASAVMRSQKIKVATTYGHSIPKLACPGGAAELIVSSKYTAIVHIDTAKIRALGSEDEDLKAAKVSLGVLGVVSTVTLQLQPTYKRSVTLRFAAEGDGMEDEILRVTRSEEFGDVIWYPGLREVVYRYDHTVGANETGDGANRFVDFRPTPEAPLTTSRALEEHADVAGNRTLKCELARASVAAQQALGYGSYKDGVSFSGFPVVGHQDLIMSAGGCQLMTSRGSTAHGSADAHCAPEKRSFCRPGRIYPAARVCRTE